MKINPLLNANLNFIPRFLIGMIMIMFSVLIQLGYSQDLVLEDMTIATTEFYTAQNSITVGPQFTVAGTGDVTFKSGNYITLKPGFVIIAGGKVNALTGVIDDIEVKFNPEIPQEFALMQNYPNPFNPTTTITYQLTKSGNVQLTIYDLLGKEIQTLVNRVQNQGKYQIIFDAGNLVSGVYLYRLQIEGAVVTKKMIVMK